MRKFVIGIAALSVLAACATQNPDGSYGAVESSIWHETASLPVKVNHFQKECEAIGFRPETDSMTNCVMVSMNSSEQTAVARDAADAATYAAIASQSAAREASRPRNCYTSGFGYAATTTCY